MKKYQAGKWCYNLRPTVIEHPLGIYKNEYGMLNIVTWYFKLFHYLLPDIFAVRQHLQNL